MRRRSAAVIGAGPAGLSAALTLARAGYETSVFERNAVARARVCGSFINPDGARALRWLGLLGEARRRGAVEVAVAELISPSGRRSRVATIQDATASLAFPREDLEALMVEELGRAGARIEWGARVTTVQKMGELTAVEHRRGEQTHRDEFHLVVAAGGRFWGNEAPLTPAGGWYGFNARFSGLTRRPGTLSLHFARRRYVGLLTFADGTTNVCGLAVRRRGEGARWEETFAALQADQPGLAALMKNATRLDEWQGVGPLPFTRRPRRLPGALLAGDAGAVGDPFMGEGIGRALGTGPVLDQALRSAPGGDVERVAERYEALWRHAYGRRLVFGWAARWLLERPSLGSPLLTALLSPFAVERALPLFHRGGGFEAAVAPSERS